MAFGGFWVGYNLDNLFLRKMMRGLVWGGQRSSLWIKLTDTLGFLATV